MKKVALIGASIPNLYASRLLMKKGIVSEIFEMKENMNNDAIRLMSRDLLDRFEFNGDNKGYVKLTDLKNHLAVGLPIRFNSIVNMDRNGDLIVNSEKIDCDVAIMNTGQKRVDNIKDNLMIYNYIVDDEKDIYAGLSLNKGIEKVEKIVSKINIS